MLQPPGLFLSLPAHRGALAGDAAEDQDVGQRIAAKTVGAMDAARHFTRGVQAGDDFAVLIDDLGKLVDAHTPMV